MADTPIGTPIPVGIIESDVNDGSSAIPAPADITPDPSDHGDPLQVTTRAVDALILASVKLGLATILAGWAFAANPFFALSDDNLATKERRAGDWSPPA